MPTVHLLNTHDTTPVITGSAKKQDPQQAGSYINLEAGDTLSVTIGGQSYTLTVGASSTPEGLTYSGGTWSLAVSTGLAQGRYDVG